jgi:hypothetical protein
MAEVCCIPYELTDMRRTSLLDALDASTRLHLKLALQALPIACSRRQSEQAIAALVGNTEVPGFEGAVEFGDIPLLRVTHIVDRKIIVLTPKERHCIKLLAKSENVPCSRLSLTLGHDPVLDATSRPFTRLTELPM